MQDHQMTLDAAPSRDTEDTQPLLLTELQMESDTETSTSATPTKITDRDSTTEQQVHSIESASHQMDNASAPFSITGAGSSAVQQAEAVDAILQWIRLLKVAVDKMLNVDEKYSLADLVKYCKLIHDRGASGLAVRHRPAWHRRLREETVRVN
jgi:hypothetical protein